MRKRAALGWMLGITAATVAAMVLWPKEQPLPVRAQQVHVQRIEQRVDGTGVVGQRGEIAVSSLTGGLVAQVYVAAGAPVAEGQPLLRLDTAAMEQALGELTRGQPALRGALADTQAAFIADAQRDQLDAQAGQLSREIAAGTIRATTTGQVLETYVRAGEVLLPGAPALRMGEQAQVVRMQLGERESLRVTPGMRARLLRDDVLLGEASVATVGLPTTRADGVVTAAVELTPDAPITLPAGARLDVEIVCRVQEQAVLAPLEALDAGENAVWVVHGQRAWRVPVVAGLMDALHAAVQGIAADTWVIVSPPQDLDNGRLVRVVSAP